MKTSVPAVNCVQTPAVPCAWRCKRASRFSPRLMCAGVKSTVSASALTMQSTWRGFRGRATRHGGNGRHFQPWFRSPETWTPASLSWKSDHDYAVQARVGRRQCLLRKRHFKPTLQSLPSKLLTAGGQTVFRNGDGKEHHPIVPEPFAAPATMMVRRRRCS